MTEQSSSSEGRTDRQVSGYLSYLREVTRKVLIRTGIKNVLKGTKASPTYYFNYSEHGEFHLDAYLRQSRLRLLKEPEKRLFMGFGLAVGSTRPHGGSGSATKIAAPCFYVPIVDISEPSEGPIGISFDWDSIQLNLDLFAELVSNNVSDEEEEHEHAPVVNPVDRDIQQLLAEADDALEKRALDPSWRDRLLGNASSASQAIEAFFRVELWQRIDSLRQRTEIVSQHKFDYKAGEPQSEKVLKAMHAAKKLYFFPQTFVFGTNLPAEISTYNAINKLIVECNANGIQNGLLRKMVGGLVLGQQVVIGDSMEERRELEAAICRLPMPLSNEQKEAIIHAWEQELSYVEGPPGTGKSHTITALMLSALMLDKKVLLVSHKKDAVHVVRRMVERFLGGHRVIYAGDDPSGRKQMQDYILDIAAKVARYDRDEQFDGLEKRRVDVLAQLDGKVAQIRHQNSLIASLVEREQQFALRHREFVQRRARMSSDVPENFDFSVPPSISGNEQLEECLSTLESLYSETFVRRGYRLSRKERMWLKRLLKTLRDDFNLPRKRLEESHEDRSSLYARRMLELLKLWQDARKIGDGIAPGALKAAREKKLHLSEDLVGLQKRYVEALVAVGVQGNAMLSEQFLRSFSKLWQWRNPQKIRATIESVDYSSLLETFPLWVGEMRHLGGYLPFKAEMFDLVIVDEASQVNIAEILPALYRGKRFCVVGDKKQLGLNSAGLFTVNKTYEQLIWNKYCGQETFHSALEKKMVLSRDSILDFITESNGLAMKSTLLSEHFRSMPALASFTSKTFYDDKLKLMKETPQFVGLRTFTNIESGGVRGKVEEDGTRNAQKVVEAEVEKVLQVLQQLIRERAWMKLEHLKSHGFTENSPPSIGIVTFTTDQRNLLREIIEEQEYFDASERNLYDVLIGTPEEFQGSERNIVLLVLAHDGRARYAKSFYEDKRRLNVATSRAINYTYFIYGGIPENAVLFKAYLRHFGVSVATIEIDQNDGTESVGAIRRYRWDFSKSRYDGALMESEFERKVADYLEMYRDERSAHGVCLYNQVAAGTNIESCGQKRLDFVLYCSKTQKSVAVEVDGQHHFEQGSGRRYGDAHLERAAILTRAGWSIVHLPYYEWYDKGWLCDCETNDKFHRSWMRTVRQLDACLGIARNE